jgi:6-pyruvoyl-tetrahydropterin synthase
MARLFVDQLTVLDFSCLDPEVGLTGQSWIVDLELEGALDEQGMVQDFGVVKRRAREAVEAVADHRLVVPEAAPGLAVEASGNELALTWMFAGGRLEHRSPASAVYRLASAEVTRGSLRPKLEAAVRAVVPGNVSDISVCLREEDISGASYRYSHGLKAHDGLCQRIAHGHRSRIQIWRDGERSEALEAQWAGRWRDIYLASREDVVAGGTATAEGMIRLGYEAREGRFELVIPADRCEILPAETTVERIADYIAAHLKAENAGSSIRVRAYEGVNKGAVAQA